MDTITRLAYDDIQANKNNGQIDVRFIGDSPQFGNVYRVIGGKSLYDVTIFELHTAARAANVQINIKEIES